MRWAGHALRFGTRSGAYRVWVGKPRKRGHFEDIDIDGRLILKYIFSKLYESVEWIDLVQDSGR
jgi:hypothetical protein